MSRPVALYIIAWIVVPILFLAYVDLAYSASLGAGSLPFLGARVLRWWMAFAVVLTLGAACTVLAAPRATKTTILQALRDSAESVSLGAPFPIQLPGDRGHTT
jgi:hypothetical protein